MSALGGILTGALALGTLDLLVTTSNGSNVASLFQVPGAVARWWVDPSKPLIPDRRSSATKNLETALAAAYVTALGSTTTTAQPATAPAPITPAPNTVPTPSNPPTLQV